MRIRVNHWCCFFDFYTHTLSRVIFCLNSWVPWCGDCAAASAWKSQLKPNMGCGWRTCVLGRRCAPTLPSPWWNGVVFLAWHQGFAPAWRRCASNISKMTILFSIHILWRKSPGICFTSMMSAQVNKFRLLDCPSFAQLKYSTFFFSFAFQYCSMSFMLCVLHMICLWPCCHAEFQGIQQQIVGIFGVLVSMLIRNTWVPWDESPYNPLLGMSSTSGGMSRNPSLEVRVPAAPLTSQRTFTVAWMRFASDCYGWWRTAGIRCNSLVFVWRRMQNPRLLGFCFKTGADSWPGNFSFTQRGDQ